VLVYLEDQGYTSLKTLVLYSRSISEAQPDFSQLFFKFLRAKGQ